MHIGVYCLDASCFSSLQKLQDAYDVLDEIWTSNSELFIPTAIYEVVMLPPNEKFQKLPRAIDHWVEQADVDNINRLDSSQQARYVQITRRLLERFSPRATREAVGAVEKIGSESIFRNKLQEKFGEIGHILFETLAISSERRARIIAFGVKTADLVKTIVSKVVKMPSNVKKNIKHGRKIATALVFLLFAVCTERIQEFLKEFQMPDIGLQPNEVLALGFTGLLVIANG